MAAPANPSANDSAFFTALLPTRGRTRFVRAVIMLFLAAGMLGWVAVGTRIYSEFHARHSWPIAQGQVTDVNVRSFTGPSSRDHVPHYFVEYEVRFAVPEGQCLTGQTFVAAHEPPLCEGIARTRTTDSQSLANSWLQRHRFNPAVEVLHDPQGPGVKIAGEPASIVYPCKEIVGMACWMIFFSGVLIITQRRLRYLKTLPEDYEASPPSPSASQAGDDLMT